MDDEEGRRLLLRVLAARDGDELRRDGLLGPDADAEALQRDLAPIGAARGVRVVDVRRNGLRVDARVEADDGATWLLVLWASRPTLDQIAGATVYARPTPFGGRGPGLVIVLNGPSSVGKSSLMRAFADRASTPFSCLDEPLFGRLPANFVAWPETLGPHVDGVLAALAAAARLGNQFIVSAAGIAQSRFQRALREVATIYVGLDAPLDVLVQRQRSQVDKFGGLAEESVDIHQGWRYDLRIETDEHTPEDAAQILTQHLAVVPRRRLDSTSSAPPA